MPGGIGLWRGADPPSEPSTYPLWENTATGAFVVWDGAAWVEAGSNVVPAGGSAGQVLTKSSGTDFALGWYTPLGSGEGVGVERLYGFHSAVLAGTATKVVFSGDSTTYGSGGSSGSDLDQLFGKMVANHDLPLTTTVNLGKSGAHTGDLVASYLPEIVGHSPNLIVLRWGANDPYYGRSSGQFDTSLRAALASLRSSFPLSGGVGIVVMTPSVMSDTPNGRDLAWSLITRDICRAAADDYSCAFIDTYEVVRDAVHAAGLWMDNPFSDGRAIHPLLTMDALIASAIFNAVYPEAIRSLSPTTIRTTALTLQNSWVNFSGTTDEAVFWKTAGMVYLQGIISGGTATNGTTIATLPTGYRPPKNVYLPVLTASAAPPTAPNPAGVYITSAGDIKTFANCAAGYLSFAGVFFRAAT